MRIQRQRLHRYFGLLGTLRPLRPRRTHRPFTVPAAADSTSGAAQPDITVIVPAFRHERYVEECLGSLVAQTYPHFRAVVVDDRSPDATVARARLVQDARIAVTVNPRNIGLADSVLAALETVTTPYVALLNSDDLFHPARLERCRQRLEARPSAHLVATGVVPVDAKGCEVTLRNVSRVWDGARVCNFMRWLVSARDIAAAAPLRLALLRTNFLVTSSNVFCRTEFIRSRRDLLRGLRYCLDWQLFVDAAACGALEIIPDDLVAYRLHGSNTIWLDEPAQRPEYLLEVNRVLAHGLRRLAESMRERSADERAAALLEALTSFVTPHPEASAYQILLAHVIGGPALSEAVRHSPAILRAADHLRAL